MKPAPMAIDQAFIDGMRARIKVANTLDKLQACVDGDKDGHMTKEQIAAARILLGKVMPDLKAVEHSGEIGKKQPSRGELIERLTALHSRAAAGHVDGGPAGAGEADGPAATTH